MLRWPLFVFALAAMAAINESSQVERRLSTSPSNVHDLFMEHYPGGKEHFMEAIRERSDWSPLQKFEYQKVEPEWRDPRWGNDHNRFNALGPVVQCPSAIFESFGKGDGEKRICGIMKDNTNCVVISVGSHNEWDFEEAVIAKYPNCRIHTLDCYVQGTVPAAIQKQVTFHPICLDIADHKLPDGKEFMTWPSVAKLIGLTAPPTALKMDIEGFEWTTIPAIIKSNILVPDSFSFELHFDTSIREVPWYGRRRTEPEIGLFIELLYSLGHVLVDRHDNEHCGSCSEIVIAKLLHNTRFNHHHNMHSIFEGNVTAPDELHTVPYPTKPKEPYPVGL